MSKRERNTRRPLRTQELLICRLSTYRQPTSTLALVFTSCLCFVSELSHLAYNIHCLRRLPAFVLRPYSYSDSPFCLLQFRTSFHVFPRTDWYCFARHSSAQRRKACQDRQGVQLSHCCVHSRAEEGHQISCDCANRFTRQYLGTDQSGIVGHVLRGQYIRLVVILTLLIIACSRAESHHARVSTCQTLMLQLLWQNYSSWYYVRFEIPDARR